MYAANLPRTSLSRNGVYYYRVRRKDFEARVSLGTKEHRSAAAIVYLLEAFRVTEEFQVLSNEALIVRCNRLVQEQHIALRNCAVSAGVAEPPPRPLDITPFDLAFDPPSGTFVPKNIGPGEFDEAVQAASKMTQAMANSPRVGMVMDPTNSRPPLAPPMKMEEILQAYSTTVMGETPGIRLEEQRLRVAVKSVRERKAKIRRFLKLAAPKTNLPREVTVQTACYFFEGGPLPQGVNAKAETLLGKAANTYNSYHSPILGFFDYCVRINQCADNPIKLVRRKTKNEVAKDKVPTASFELDQLHSIFGHPDYPEKKEGEEGYYWGPILLFLTGARPGELTQARLDDYQKGVEGWYLRIDNQFELQHLKTPNSRRHVPLHPVLQDLGFFDWLESEKKKRRSEELLFPQFIWTINGHAKNLSRDFNERFLIKIDFPATRHNRSLKSFRHSFVKLLTERGANPYVLKPLVGHGTELVQGVSKDDAHEEYSKEYSQSAELRLIMKLPVEVLTPLLPKKS